jgi:gas vesicle protein
MSDEWKDRRLKYVELPNQFRHRANDIAIISKQHLRHCQALAKQLAGRKPKTADEFEKVEAMKDFVVKSAELNEKTIELLDYVKSVIQEITNDVTDLSETSLIHDRLKDQSEALQMAWSQRDALINDLYAQKRTEFAKHS